MSVRKTRPVMRRKVERRGRRSCSVRPDVAYVYLMLWDARNAERRDRAGWTFPLPFSCGRWSVDGILIDGPGRLTRAFGIDRRLNRLRPHGWDKPSGLRIVAITATRGTETFPRIGVDYAGVWAKKPWRFRLQAGTDAGRRKG